MHCVNIRIKRVNYLDLTSLFLWFLSGESQTLGKIGNFESRVKVYRIHFVELNRISGKYNNGR